MACLINRDCHYTNENHPFILHQLNHLSTFGTLLVSVVIYVKGGFETVSSPILHIYCKRTRFSNRPYFNSGVVLTHLRAR